MPDSAALQHRIGLLTDFLTVVGRLGEFFEVIRREVDADELAREVATAFAIRGENAEMLVDMPIREWGTAGVRRRAAELEMLRAAPERA